MKHRLTVRELLETIHRHCLECGGSEEDIINCQSNKDTALYSKCALYPFRLGKSK